jgi:hypothetical protein
VPRDINIYARPEVDLVERAKYVADLIDQLRELETKTDPKGGVQSAKGKNRAALEALRISSTLVKVLSGWALDHEAGLAVKGLKHVPLRAAKPPKDADDSNAPPTDDDHRHEWYGRNSIGAGNFPGDLDPIVARKWLMNLLRANTGIFEIGLRWDALMALEACDYGEILPLLKATKKNRKVDWTILQLRLRAIECVYYRVAQGTKKYVAEEEVAKAFDRDVTTIRSWERRLKTDFGDAEVAERLEFARNHAARNTKGTDVWQTRYDKKGLERYAQQHKVEMKRRSGPPS